MNQMIEHAKKTDFRLPFLLIPIVAFGLNLLSDMAGGTPVSMLCTTLRLGEASTNRLLLATPLVNALVIFLWISLIENRRISTLGFTKRAFFQDSAVGALGGIVSFSLILVIGMAFNVVSLQSSEFTFLNALNVFLMIPFWMIQAGAEEILTRGFVLPEVSARSNRLVGILLSSLLFVVLHIGNLGLNVFAVLNIFLVGVLLSVYTLKSDSLWGAIMFHTFWNFSQGSLFGLSVSGNTAMKPTLMNFLSDGMPLLSGGTFGIEASLITTGVLLLFILLLLCLPVSKSNL